METLAFIYNRIDVFLADNFPSQKWLWPFELLQQVSSIGFNLLDMLKDPEVCFSLGGSDPRVNLVETVLNIL